MKSGTMIRVFCVGILWLALAVDRSSAQQELQGYLTHAHVSGLIEGEPIYQPDLVASFYTQNEWQLAWSDMMNISFMIGIVQRADEEGLNPADYHLASLRLLYDEPALDVSGKAKLDILLTDAFMQYSMHLLHGKLNPINLYPEEWIPQKRTRDLVFLLRKALIDNSVVSQVASFCPSYAGYKKLKLSLKKFQSIQDKEIWPLIENGKSLEVGMKDSRVPVIQDRLKHWNASITFLSDSVYDSLMVNHIKLYQRQHGIEDDGIIGKRTIQALNLTPADYVNRIKVNMERYRWLPDNFGDEYIVVNIPAYQMSLYKGDSLVMQMNAIVGRPERKTPVFASEIRYLILNPTWTVPPTILREDALPAIRKNINYLKRNNIRVINRKGEEIDPYGLPWYKYTDKNFPYQLQQDAGPNNSLGLIKFQLVNSFRVFLHDTNLHHLFRQQNRALSSGCVRLEQPFHLAAYLLQGTRWTRTRMDEVIETGETTTVMIPKRMPVYFVYFTASVWDTHLQLQEDVYSWDEKVINGLSEPAAY
jgi:murein L,D-transpeptidase YcbB/YkuD